MTAVVERVGSGAELSTARVRQWLRRERDGVAPSLFAALNAIAFVLVAPNVNDIFAALSRESAAQHSVGLTYWFSWFGGGTTPGNYSVITPWLSTLIGAGLLCALATAAITPLAWIALRGTAHPVAGVWVVSVCAGMNLWSGRVPFAVGSAVAVVTMICVVRRWTLGAVASAVLALLATPLSGAFIGIALVAVFIVRKELRRICWITCVVLLVCLVGATAIFGQPGPQSFSFGQMLQMAAILLLFLFARPADYVRATIWTALFVCPFLFFIPNGLGDNVLRLGWYCLPGVVVATATRRMRTALLAIALALAFAVRQGVVDLTSGAQNTASVGYYTSLIHELDLMQPQLLDYRLEVADDGTHTAAFALLNHAMLARGWETQDDNALNSSLERTTLDATTYKLWLQDNAVGYVAIAATSRLKGPEYQLVSQHRPGYLARVWGDKDWTLYQVANPDPIVSDPEAITARSQSRLTLSVPCACTFPVRVRYSKYLTATRHTDHLRAKVANDGSGWTMLTTTGAGTYVLSGDLTTGLLH